MEINSVTNDECECPKRQNSPPPKPAKRPLNVDENVEDNVAKKCNNKKS